MIETKANFFQVKDRMAKATDSQIKRFNRNNPLSGMGLLLISETVQNLVIVCREEMANGSANILTVSFSKNIKPTDTKP